MITKKTINIRIMSCLLAGVFTPGLSFSANAEDMKLQEAKEQITELEQENTSLEQELEIYENKIAEHRAKLEESDKKAMEMKVAQ